ncbi:MAG: outer membrane biogenesis protein BamB [bacterium ADurb.BinA186]|nr:MAG: outer membrane biogenesis protein BamB [bacterium ADurb.BinA186]
MLAPHPDGYLSILNIDGGQTEKPLVLSPARINRSFPDIIAPMLLVGQTLWIASYSNGLLAVDIKSWQIKERIDIMNIHQLAHKEDTIFAANDKSLYAIKSGGQIVWQNNFFQLRTRVAAQSSSFVGKNEIGKRVFLGLVSRLLIRDNEIIMGTSLGAMGMFDLRNGSLIQVVGNSLGFGPKISFGGNSVLALTRRGSVVRF